MASTNSATVTAIYQAIAGGLNPPAADLSTYTALMTSSGWTVAQVAAAIETEPFILNAVNPVIREYQAAFGRVPDQAGLSFWIKQVAPNGPTGALNTSALNALATTFANSTEFQSRYGASFTATTPITSLNGGALVTALYENILGRAPDAAGLNYWLTANVTVAQLLNAFAQSGEFITDTTNAIQAFETAEANGAAVTTGSLLALGNNGVTTVLTSAIDTLNLKGDGATVVGAFGGTAANAINSFNTGDTVTASTGSINTLILDDQGTGGHGTNVAANPGNIVATVSGVSTLDINSGESVLFNATTAVEGFAGLTQLNVTVNDSAGFTAPSITANSTITAAASTNVSLTDLGLGNGDIDIVLGGDNVTVIDQIAGGGAGGVFIGQSTLSFPGTGTAPTGAVNVTTNMSAAATGAQVGAFILVHGGTSINITANLAEAVGGAANSTTGSAIGVTGASATTSVSITQSAAATAADAVSASPGALAAALVAAAPGVQGVTASTAAAATASKAAVAGVIDGQVQIQDASYGTASANSITSVTLVNPGNGTSIKDNALTSLNISGVAPINSFGLTNATNGSKAPNSNTTLGLTVSAVGSTAGNGIFFDVNNELTTLNVTTGASASYLSISDTHLATLTVSGSSFLSVGVNPLTTLTTITISGAASFSDGVAPGAGALGSNLPSSITTGFTTTSSGTITATMDDTAQTFTGSTGQDTITIFGDATRKITGGSAAGNEVVFNAASTVFNATAAHLTNANVTGFSVFGLGVNSTGTYDLSTYNSGFKTIDITAAAGSNNIVASIVNAATGAALAIDGTDAGGSVSLGYADTNGATDSTAVTLGVVAATPTELLVVVNSLTLQDANGVGVGNVSITSPITDVGTAAIGGAINTINTLVDNGLSSLAVAGGAGLSIGAINQNLHQATAMTIASNETGLDGTTIGTLTDQYLGSITFTGSNTTTIGDLQVEGANSVTVLALTNSGTGLVSVDATGTQFSDNNILKTLTLAGAVAFGPNPSVLTTPIGSTTGFTLNAATDNAHINISATGAAAGATDTLTVGNNNNGVLDFSAAGTVKITVGTGSNVVDVGDVFAPGTTAATASYSITLGAHTSTNFDYIAVADLGAYAPGPVAATTVIAGALVGDQVHFTDTVTAVNPLSAANLASLAGAATLQAAIASAASLDVGAHSADAFLYGGNTYIVEVSTAATLTATAAVVELTGSHTVGVSTVYPGLGVLAVLS